MNKGGTTNVDITHHVRWQIPRASLSSGSRSIYSSTDSIQGSAFDQYNGGKFNNGNNRRNRRRESYSTGSDTKNDNSHYKSKKLNEQRDEGPYSMPSTSSSGSSLLSAKNKKFSRRKFSESLIMNGSNQMTIDELSSAAAAAADERVHGNSSRSSSQGSSSNSLHSASSLLLSVQNLEKFTRMTNKQERINNLRSIGCDNENDKLQIGNSDETILDMNKVIDNDTRIDTNHQQNNLTKHKEHDQLSIASSTHFTLINGCGRSNLKPQNSFCRHGRQITILIVTMTTFFIIGILIILYLMDRRAKAMPAFHQ